MWKKGEEWEREEGEGEENREGSRKKGEVAWLLLNAVAEKRKKGKIYIRVLKSVTFSRLFLSVWICLKCPSFSLSLPLSLSLEAIYPFLDPIYYTI